jgi:hypothetical protein
MSNVSHTSSLDSHVPTELLEHKRCWGIIAGAGTGSDATFHFGAKIDRPRKINNPSLSAALQKSEGELILFVQCGWVLRDVGKVICDSQSSNRAGKSMLNGLDRLVDERVESADQSFSPAQLEIHFGGGLILYVRIHSSHEEESYSLFVPGAVYIVGSDSRVHVEPRQVRTSTHTLA